MEQPATTEIRYGKAEGIAKITINRPHAYNAFTTTTLEELTLAFEDAERDPAVGVAVLTGAGDKAFCSGGDVKEAARPGGYGDENAYWHNRLHHSIRSVSKPTIAAVNGYAIGGGHILHLLCDVTIASENAKFGQAGPRVGSFDGGFGASYLARVVGERKAREIWFFCRQYSAQEALEMGLVNKVVPLADLDREVETWCSEVKEMSPYAIRFLKQSFNADTDHIAGFENMSMSAVRLYWDTDEAKRQKETFKKRQEEKKASRK